MFIEPNLEDGVRVTVIATGFGERAADDTTLTMTQVVNTKEVAPERIDLPAFARKQKEGPVGEVIKLKKLSVLSSAEDEEKYEIPTFLRKQVD